MSSVMAFRSKVKEFCDGALPAELKWKVQHNQILEKSDYVSWQRTLRAHGWFGGHWPKAFGGRGWSKLKQWVFEDELARCGAPWLIPFGVSYVGPVLYTFGSDAQKARFLEPILNSEIWWAQGYSEPNAGSDLASLKTSAKADGDDYRLNGQKTWTTYAQWADYIFVLARTDVLARPQEGISFFLVDTTSPGVTVRPIRTIDGRHHLNEVFFDDVRVGSENLVGRRGEGWAYAKFILGNERLLVAEVGKARRMVREILAVSEQFDAGHTHWWRRELASIEVDIASLEAMCLELLSDDCPDDASAVAPFIKIAGSELIQRLQSVAQELFTRDGAAFHLPALRGAQDGIQRADAAGAISDYLHGRAISIYGGSNEIQRNLLAKSILGSR